MLVYGAGAAWSRPCLPEAGADPFWSKPESAPGPWTSRAGAAQKSGGSVTLELTAYKMYMRPKAGDTTALYTVEKIQKKKKNKHLQH